MAYDHKNLSVLAYANGFTLWHYRTEDTLKETNAVGYFNQGTDMLRTGDMIMANVGAGSANSGGCIFLVAEAPGGAVRTVDFAGRSSDDSAN